MIGKVVDELLYLGLGALAAELVDGLAVKYADPRPGMNIAMLGAKAGKPSVYVPGGTGILALGYAGYRGNKFGRLDEIETALAGYGVYVLAKTAGKLLAPATTAPPATSFRYTPAGVIPRQLQQAPSGAMRGSV